MIRKDGKVHTFDFRDLRNAADVRMALEGIRLRLPPAPVEPTPDAPASVPLPPA